MALVDVKQYYLNVLSQYVEMKNDLEDFEQALKDGHITEDQLEYAKKDVEDVKSNVDRLAYILYLFELPKRDSKKAKYLKANRNLAEVFKNMKVDEDSIFEENKSLIDNFREELKKFKTK